MGNKQFLSIFVLAAASMIAAASLAGAIGISSPFLDKNTMDLAEGTGTTFTIALQNIEKTDMTVKFDYTSDKGIANVIDYKEVYLLPAGTVDNKIVFNITAPKDARINDMYEVRYSVLPQQSTGSTIAFTPGIGRSFKVVITKDPNKFYLANYIQEKGMMWAVIVLVLISYVAYGAYKRRRQKRKQKT